MAKSEATLVFASGIRLDWRQASILLTLLGLLTVFILVPIVRVLWVSLSDGEGGLTLVHFANFFRRPLFRESLWNSLVAGLLVVFFGSLIAVPLAYLSVRYDFKGKILVNTLSTLPLVIPPFVGAVALQLILGRSGTVNLLLMRWFDTSIPFMEGLTGVVLVQTLHFFPFIMLNTAVSLSNIDPSLEEMAQNMGCHGLRLFRRVTLPLMLPGFIAGCLLTFIRAVDDLGTPLMLNYKTLLAPQAYLRITTIGIDDVDGYVICVILVAISLGSLLVARKYLSLSEYATLHQSAAVARPVAGRNLLDAVATLPIAIPGVVLAVGYLRVFHGWDFPGLGAPLTSTWIILVVAYTVRRLPYTVRASYAALQQVHVSLEESAQNLGANRLRTFIRVTLPLISGGLVAGGLIAFITSCVELSSTIMLVPRIESGPISYGIYIYMQSPLGRAAGAALGVVAIVLVSLGTYLTYRIFGGRTGSAFRL